MKDLLSVSALANVQVSWYLDSKCQIGYVQEKEEQNKDRTLTNIIHNIKLAPIVITAREIKLISSDVSMTGASIGWCQAASQED